MTLAPRTGSLVERYLFSPLYAPTSAWAVVGWWERRRLFYNIAVGTAGLVTTALAFLSAALVPGPQGPPLPFILVYALGANLFYSLGAPIDLLLRRQLKENAGPVAQALFRYGLAFAIGLTLLPIPLLVLSTIVRFFLR
ncbi:MAG TPA: hypothetical protein VG692_15545 [Gemmatimonadales bacterium]|nr:hypothetical protein [Gemmatimonadales bacterium]